MGKELLVAQDAMGYLRIYLTATLDIMSEDLFTDDETKVAIYAITIPTDSEGAYDFSQTLSQDLVTEVDVPEDYTPEDF